MVSGYTRAPRTRCRSWGTDGAPQHAVARMNVKDGAPRLPFELPKQAEYPGRLPRRPDGEVGHDREACWRSPKADHRAHPGLPDGRPGVRVARLPDGIGQAYGCFMEMNGIPTACRCSRFPRCRTTGGLAAASARWLLHAAQRTGKATAWTCTVHAPCCAARASRAELPEHGRAVRAARFTARRAPATARTSARTARPSTRSSCIPAEARCRCRCLASSMAASCSPSRARRSSCSEARWGKRAGGSDGGVFGSHNRRGGWCRGSCWLPVRRAAASTRTRWRSATRTTRRARASTEWKSSLRRFGRSAA